MRALIRALALAVLTALAAPLAAAQSDDVPVDVADDDAVMNAAIAEARRTLPEFWAAFEAKAPGTEMFMLKLRLEQDGMGEHFWMANIERKDGKIFGTLDNEPYYVKTVKKGQRLEIPEADISDWSFIRNGKFVGNRTMCAVLHTLPKAEADYWRDQFETPCP